MTARQANWGEPGDECSAALPVEPGSVGMVPKKKVRPAVPDLASPVVTARNLIPREIVKRGGTGAAKWQAHQISVRNRTRSSLEKTLFLSVKPVRSWRAKNQAFKDWG